MTDVYTRATIVEVAQALVGLTAEPHPLVRHIGHVLIGDRTGSPQRADIE